MPGCASDDSVGNRLHALQGVVLVLYSLLQRRTKLCQDCCFGGYCVLPVYVKLIH